jgi:methylglutaconyl-CoA hydratase
MSNDGVIYRQYSEEVAASVLNRPEKRNALNSELLRQLCAHAGRVEKDGKIRVWILRGNGPSFCAGLDVGEALDPLRGVESARMVKQCLTLIYQVPVVTIAMVHGAAMGGGAGLAAACDFAVADTNATIGFPEARRGLIPAQVMSVLVRKLRRADVRELLLSGATVSAERALHMGLFNRVGEIEVEAQDIISKVLQAAPGALAKTKQLLDQLSSRRLQDDIELCLRQYLQVREGAEAQEGISAFLEKRKPLWEKNWKFQL